jgi:hypothetical protein
VNRNDAADELRARADLITPMAIRVAATLRIADHIAGGVRDAPTLAAAVDADPDVLGRLMRHLVVVGVLSRDGSGLYGLTAMGEALRAGHAHDLRAGWDIEGAVGRADLAAVRLLHSVRTGEAAYPAQFGRSFWEDLDSDPRLAASFDALMGADVALEAPAIVAAYDWGSLGQVVDVGGGNGTLLIALLRAYPDLRGAVVDLPSAAEAARNALNAAGLSARSEAIAGSFFDAIPAGAGGYLLSAVVHNWDDEPARAILGACARAAAPAGRVFVIERVTAGGEPPSTSRDLRMLVYFGARERNLDELTALAAEAGLHRVAVHDAEVNSILELSPQVRSFLA